MNYRVFGSTGIKVSEIGMGCSSLGGGLYHGNRREALATLQAAFDAGISFYDTADNYSQGESERLIGEAFRDKRKNVVIATKGGAVFSPVGRVGLRIKPLLRPLKALLKPAQRQLHQLRDAHKKYDHSLKRLIPALEGSLKRLRTDYVDIYQLYNPSHESLQAGEVFRTLEALKRSGKIRHAGVSCVTVEDALLCLQHPVVSSVQVTVNLLDREAIPQLLPQASGGGVGVIARVPLAQGLLTSATGDTMAQQSARDEAKFLERKRAADLFRFLITPQRTLAQAALRFVLGLPGVSVTLAGMVSRKELSENLGALSISPLSPDELSRINNTR